MNIQVVLFDGFDPLDAIAPYEVLHAASVAAGGCWQVELVTAEGPRLVTSGTNGLRIQAEGTLDPQKAGLLLVPGASGEVDGDGPDSIPAILARASATDLIPLMKRAMIRPDLITVTVCGGSLLLAMGGLLEGRRAVTHHMGMDVLGSTGALPVAARVVDDGNLITGGGVTSGLDVALYVVERELGPQIAHSVERLFEYERRGTVWRAQGLQPVAARTPEEEATAFREVPPAELSVEGEADGLAEDHRFDGMWEVTISTPIGRQAVTLIISARDGRIQGTATQGEETVEMLNPVVSGVRLVWSQRVTRPMRLNLKFEVSVTGDAMSGTAKAGMLPSSKLEGTRILSTDR